MKNFFWLINLSTNYGGYKMDRRNFIKLSVGSLALSVLNFPQLSFSSTNKERVKLIYSAKLPYEGKVRLWLPVPMNTDYQRLLSLEIKGTHSLSRLTKDAVYSAPILYLEFPDKNEKQVEVIFDVEFWSRNVDLKKLPKNNTRIPSEVALYLKPTQHIPTDGIVKEYADKITKGLSTDYSKVRAIYDWVVDNTFRDPKVLGCGTGDVKAMLESGYFGGKCTDISSLFVALCRASGIPAREIFGIRVKASSLSKGISGVAGDATKAQHCRAEFWLGQWVPADPADVRKFILEEKIDSIKDERVKFIREFMFGGWDLHWVAFNYARDFEPEPPLSSRETINELMYPIAEVSGKLVDKYKLTFEQSKYRVEVV
jgi:transglutaminase-like putative cysteine protease